MSGQGETARRACGNCGAEIVRGEAGPFCPRCAAVEAYPSKPETARVHRSKMGTYHAAPQHTTPSGDPCDGTCNDEASAWTINDTRGYMDGGPSCDECGACECDCLECPCRDPHFLSEAPDCACECHGQDAECIGLSFAYVCLDGGESLCEDCASKAGVVIVDCDCE